MSIQKFFGRAFVIMSLVGLGSCMGTISKSSSGSSKAASPSSISSNRSLDEIEDDLFELTKNVSCNDVDSDCEIVQYGLNSCGSPTSALAYAKASADANKVGLLVGEFNAVYSKAHQGEFSTCMIPSLKAVCQNKQCQVVND